MDAGRSKIGICKLTNVKIKGKKGELRLVLGGPEQELEATRNYRSISWGTTGFHPLPPCTTHVEDR